MDKEKVTHLAKSLSAACKQAVIDKQLIQKLSSPQAAMLVLSVLAVTVNVVDPKSKWA